MDKLDGMETFTAETEQEAARDRLEKVRRFIKDNTSYFALDKTDFRRAKFYASGSGWHSDLGRSWGEGRANAHLDIIAPICDSTVNAFTRNPFTFSGLGEGLSSKINEVMAEALREACQDGLSFVYVWHDEENRMNIRRISNLHVMWTETECLVIDKKKVDYENASAGSIWNNLDVLSLASNEIPVLTHFRLKDGVVEISKIEDEKIIAETSINLPHLPIIPVRGKQVLLSDNQVHHRGYHFTLRHLCSAFCANLSVSLERMISRDPVLLAEESLGDSEYTKQWEENGTRNYYVYKSLHGIDPVTNQTIKLDPPILNPQVNDISKLEALRASLLSLVDRTVGSNYASENAGNETATAVLLRNQNKEDALSQILLNLSNAAKRIVRVLQAYLAEIGEPLPEEVAVTDNVSQGIKNTNSIQLLLSVKDLPLSLQLAVLNVYDAPADIISAVASEMRNQQDPDKQRMEAQVQQLTHQLQLEQVRAKEAEATFAAAQIEAEQRYATKMEELKVERELKLAQMEIEKAKILLEQKKLELEFEKHNMRRDVDVMKLEQKDKVDTIGLMQNAEIQGAKIAESLNPNP